MWNAVVLRLAMQVYEERNVTARPHNSFEDQQMCDLVKMLDNQYFFPDNVIGTIDTLGILDSEYEGTEQTYQPRRRYTSQSAIKRAVIAFKLPPKSKEEV
jgi:hypothetical protein